ncbi:MAG: hypothetical protein FGM24_08680 [Candidatus Kapabacteria bacterium]|nr:hypothetical protein [Candidatus Kapabacteria bacterium]
MIFTDQGAEYVVAVSGLMTLTAGTPLVEIMGEPCAAGAVPLISKLYSTAGTALPRDSIVELTPSVTFSRGAIWARDKVDFRNRFSMLVGFRMTRGDNLGEEEEVPSDPGADGVAIVVQNQAPDAIGQYGRGIGYDGIKQSLAIEFDTYHNTAVNDPNGNHIGVQSMGRLENTSRHGPPANLAFTSSIPSMKADGTVYYAFVEYADARLRVYFNDRPSFLRPVVERYVNLDSLIGLDADGRAWVGVTSATGQSIEQHEIVQWEINSCAADATVGVDTRSQEAKPIDISFTINDSRLLRRTDDVVTVTVHDCQGRFIWTAVTNDLDIDLSEHVGQSGCYIVRVLSPSAVYTRAWMFVR